ncbi:3-hydroxyacyl-CoA dehydrogenase NAD-binding domain-containing protein [Actinomadura keratinilytica]|uniref:3-hydroxyacyl-CoA dehydrogenase NAD-binding domain-containing protein n=1 Tax=Actinomadura keratinilytica TaxID=547461 RepID=UPI003605EDBB
MDGWAERVGTVRVVGTGVMGRGIAQLAAAGGLTVELADVRPEAVAAAVEYVSGMFGKLVAKGRMTAEDAAAAKARLRPVDGPLAPADGCDLVIEAVREDLATKRELFAGLEKVCPEHTVLATNTSSLSVTAIGAGLADPSRLAGLHFFNPVPLMRLVEVIAGARTAAWLPGALTGLVRRLGHEPVLAPDTPGFLVNHAGRGLVTEALQILGEAVAEPADVDRIARDVLGLRMGPFELLDLTGLDVSHPVLESIWTGFYDEPRLRPSRITRARMEAGLLGRKAGEGFYRYVDGAKQEPPEARPPPPRRVRSGCTTPSRACGTPSPPCSAGTSSRASARRPMRWCSSPRTGAARWTWRASTACPPSGCWASIRSAVSPRGSPSACTPAWIRPPGGPRWPRSPRPDGPSRWCGTRPRRWRSGCWPRS